MVWRMRVTHGGPCFTRLESTNLMRVIASSALPSVLAAASAVAAVVSAVVAVRAIRWGRVTAIAARDSAQAAAAQAEAAAAQAEAAVRTAASDEQIAATDRERIAHERAERAKLQPPQLDTRPDWGLINGRLIGWVDNVGVSRLRLESAELDDHQSGTAAGFWRSRGLLKPLKPRDAETIEFPWTDASTDRWMTVTVAFQAVDSIYRAETNITLKPVAPQYTIRNGRAA